MASKHTWRFSFQTHQLSDSSLHDEDKDSSRSTLAGWGNSEFSLVVSPTASCLFFQNTIRVQQSSTQQPWLLACDKVTHYRNPSHRPFVINTIRNWLKLDLCASSLHFQPLFHLTTQFFPTLWAGIASKIWRPLRQKIKFIFTESHHLTHHQTLLSLRGPTQKQQQQQQLTGLLSLTWVKPRQGRSTKGPGPLAELSVWACQQIEWRHHFNNHPISKETRGRGTEPIKSTTNDPGWMWVCVALKEDKGILSWLLFFMSPTHLFPLQSDWKAHGNLSSTPNSASGTWQGPGPIRTAAAAYFGTVKVTCCCMPCCLSK